MFGHLPNVPNVVHAHSGQVGRCNDAACPEWPKQLARKLAASSTPGSGLVTVRANVSTPRGRIVNVRREVPAHKVVSRSRSTRLAGNTPAQKDNATHAVRQVYRKTTTPNLDMSRAWSKARKTGGIRLGPAFR